MVNITRGIAIGLVNKSISPHKHRCIVQLRETEYEIIKRYERFIHRMITSQNIPINNVYNSKR